MKRLEKANFICTTADCWSTNNKSFLGVTVYWIDQYSESLERKSAALRCERFTGRHTYDVIAEKLVKIHADYKITTKTLATVTDNGSNFVKAFTEFSQTLTEVQVQQPLQNELNDDNEDDDTIDQYIVFEDMDNILTRTQEQLVLDEEDGLKLPPHQRCASHTLNLVAVHDINTANSDAAYKKL